MKFTEESNNTSLGFRLQNCLQTILELEGFLSATPLGKVVQVELSTLKKVVQQLENVKVEENDVCRIEAATSRFLEELKETLEEADEHVLSASRLLQ